MKERILAGAIILFLVTLAVYIKINGDIGVKPPREDFTKIETTWSNTKNLKNDSGSMQQEEISEERVITEENNKKIEKNMTDQEILDSWELLSERGDDINFFVVTGGTGNTKLDYGIYGYTGNDKEKPVLLYAEDSMRYYYFPYIDQEYDRDDWGIKGEDVYFIKSDDIYSGVSSKNNPCGLFIYKKGKVSRFDIDIECEGSYTFPVSFNEDNRYLFLRSTTGEDKAPKKPQYFDLNNKEKVLLFGEHDETESIEIFYNKGDHMVFSKSSFCLTPKFGRYLSKNLWSYNFTTKEVSFIEDISDWVVSDSVNVPGFGSLTGEYNITGIKNYNPNNNDLEYDYEIDRYADCEI